jgi:hypothetical protein
MVGSRVRVYDLRTHDALFGSLIFSSMDGRDKKRLEVIKQKLQLLRQKLAGAKRQDDEPGEVRKLEQEIATLEAEATKLRA